MSNHYVSAKPNGNCDSLPSSKLSAEQYSYLKQRKIMGERFKIGRQKAQKRASFWEKFAASHPKKEN